MPTGREENWGPKFIPFRAIVRGNKNADTWFEMAALTIDLGNNNIPPWCPHRFVVPSLGADLPGSRGPAASGLPSYPAGAGAGTNTGALPAPGIQEYQMSRAAAADPPEIRRK